MGCIPYQTARDANSSLLNTIILHDGIPHYVTEVSSGRDNVASLDQIVLRLHPIPMRGGGAIVTNLADPRLDITSMRIGYLNTDHDSLWCTRFPVRGAAQGLCNRNVSVNHITNTGFEVSTNFLGLAESPSMLHMFSNTYPSVQEILSGFQRDKQIRSRAFSRLFALSRDDFRGDYIVYYRTDKVAFGNLDDGSVRMAPRFEYLKEQLMELGLNVLA